MSTARCWLVRRSPTRFTAEVAARHRGRPNRVSRSRKRRIIFDELFFVRVAIVHFPSIQFILNALGIYFCWARNREYSGINCILFSLRWDKGEHYLSYRPTWWLSSCLECTTFGTSSMANGLGPNLDFLGPQHGPGSAPWSRIVVHSHSTRAEKDKRRTWFD